MRIPLSPTCKWILWSCDVNVIVLFVIVCWTVFCGRIAFRVMIGYRLDTGILIDQSIEALDDHWLIKNRWLISSCFSRCGFKVDLSYLSLSILDFCSNGRSNVEWCSGIVFCRMMVTVLVVWKGRKGRKRRKSSVDEEAGDDPFHEGWSSVPCGSYS